LHLDKQDRESVWQLGVDSPEYPLLLHAATQVYDAHDRVRRLLDKFSPTDEEALGQQRNGQGDTEGSR
jgi:hypothetical protein